MHTYKVTAVDTDGLDWHWFITALDATDAIIEAMNDNKANYREIARIRAKREA